MARTIKSMCLSGLSVSRPARFAVSSPRRSAAYPCAHSCSVMHMRAGTTESSSLSGTDQSRPRIIAINSSILHLKVDYTNFAA